MSGLRLERASLTWLLPILALLGVSAWSYVCGSGQGKGLAAPVPRNTQTTPAPAQAIAANPKTPSLTRDLFRYRDEAAVPAQSIVASAPQQDAAPAPTPAPIRLVGFVKNASGRKAALSLDGGVQVVSVGSVCRGLRVISIDEEEGVRLRDDQGRETLLSPPNI
jgi:hypothetical protein